MRRGAIGERVTLSPPVSPVSLLSLGNVKVFSFDSSISIFIHQAVTGTTRLYFLAVAVGRLVSNHFDRISEQWNADMNRTINRVREVVEGEQEPIEKESERKKERKKKFLCVAKTRKDCAAYRERASSLSRVVAYPPTELRKHKILNAANSVRRTLVREERGQPLYPH